MTDDQPLGPLRQTPEIDAVFADRLEASLRTEHAGMGAKGPAPRVWRRVALLGPALLLIFVVTAVLVLRDDAPSAALELTVAENVTVTLPDGSSLHDPVGVELIDGALLTIGPGGRAVIGDIELGEGTVVVRGGEIVTADPATTTSAPPERQPPPITTVAPTDEAVDAAPPVAPRDRTAPDGEEDDAPAASDEPAPASTTESPREPESGTDETDRGEADLGDATVDETQGDAATSEPERIVDLALRVRLVDRGVRVVWGASGVGLEDVRVVLLRSSGSTDDTPGPDWPPSGSVVVLAETEASAVGSYDDVLPAEGVVVRYRTIALVDGVVVARSAVQTLAR